MVLAGRLHILRTPTSWIALDHLTSSSPGRSPLLSPSLFFLIFIHFHDHHCYKGAVHKWDQGGKRWPTMGGVVDTCSHHCLVVTTSSMNSDVIIKGPPPPQKKLFCQKWGRDLWTAPNYHHHYRNHRNHDDDLQPIQQSLWTRAPPPGSPQVNIFLITRLSIGIVTITIIVIMLPISSSEVATCHHHRHNYCHHHDHQHDHHHYHLALAGLRPAGPKWIIGMIQF